MALPDVPKGESKYVKLQNGENKLRILADPLVGKGFWAHDKRVRKRLEELIGQSELDEKSKIKEFWAFPVFNYEDDKVQIFEIHQVTIMSGLKSLEDDNDWGDLVDYDIVINRSGDSLDTEYLVIPKPKATLAKNVKKAWEEIKKTLDLNQLFDGSDPFDGDPAEIEKQEEANKLPDDDIPMEKEVAIG